MELINFHVIGVGIKKGNGNVKYHDTSYINIYIITIEKINKMCKLKLCL